MYSVCCGDISAATYTNTHILCHEYLIINWLVNNLALETTL